MISEINIQKFRFEIAGKLLVMCGKETIKPSFFAIGFGIFESIYRIFAHKYLLVIKNLKIEISTFNFTFNSKKLLERKHFTL